MWNVRLCGVVIRNKVKGNIIIKLRKRKIVCKTRRIGEETGIEIRKFWEIIRYYEIKFPKRIETNRRR